MKNKASGTPVIIKGAVSEPLEKIRIGGDDNPFDESWLQKLIYRHPACLPMDEIESGFQELVPICMELGLTCGSLDNLFMTPDGNIVIVEVKLWRNPEMRRAVIAQALDYATDLFNMDYEALEKAVLKADFAGGRRPTKLYDIFGSGEVLEEPDFIDKVNRNLESGRIVVLVAADGTNSKLENLVEGLQSHAGFHFTFALIELEVFRRSQAKDEYLIVPNTLAKTYNIERGVVRVDDQRTEVIATSIKPKTTASARMSITSEQFFDDMKEIHPELPKNLKTFMEKLETIGVYFEFRKTLIFRWNTPEGQSINLGYIERNGKVWVGSWGSFEVDKRRVYLEQLADALGGEVSIEDNGMRYFHINGQGTRIEDIMDKFDDWYDVIKSYQEMLGDIE
ncbi:MAG: hypothetical protein COA60_009150 [Robiginitomaculum sp.]|nr:hypothetical protein [Robiginitomaculum sp.]